MIKTIHTLAWSIVESRVGAEENLLGRAGGNTSFKICLQIARKKKGLSKSIFSGWNDFLLSYTFS
jgi:hypothetical protein